MNTVSKLAAGAAAITLIAAGPALAQDTPEFAAAGDTAYIFNTTLFLMAGFLVMFMAAGFAMLEAGLVRSKNVSMQCLKNIGLYSIAGIMFWLVGYNLMYEGVNNYFGTPLPKSIPAPDADAGDYAAASDWFFQMVFCAATASIVSGTLAERIKLWPFFLFTAVLTGVFYPITGSWQWGEGWLYKMGFSDFAGSTIVHSVGGWAALAGAIILGARKGKYGAGGEVHPMPGSSIPLATLGTFMLWLGWFGFNGGSQLALGSIADDVLGFAHFRQHQHGCRRRRHRGDGADPDHLQESRRHHGPERRAGRPGCHHRRAACPVRAGSPIIIGGVGGAIVVFAVPLLDKLKIDDVVGAIPVHLFAGIWGTLIVPLSNSDASWSTQIVGIVAYGAFTFIASGVLWFVLSKTVGIRVSEEDEALGLDKAEVGVEAYPEFGQGSQRL